MSCTSPRCAIVPLRGGSPIFSNLVDIPKGNFLHPVHGMCKVVYIPCGGCLACRRERRMDLTVLQSCEASLHQDNWFITLTYDDARTFDLTGFPPYSLDRVHLSDFNLSMRKHMKYLGYDWRYFACGEYGEKYGRPHYHLSVFGVTPQDLGLPFQVDVEQTRRLCLGTKGIIAKVKPGTFDSQGREYWQSPVIEKFWPFGSHKIYRANRETFQYVAGYVTKKLTGDMAKKERKQVGLESEFQAQSRPSIGYPWFLKYVGSLSSVDRDKLVNDCVEIAGVSWRCPRIFSKWLAAMDHFDGKLVADRLSELRSRSQADEPDRDDLFRISRYDRYRAEQYKQTNTHKEIQ